MTRQLFRREGGLLIHRDFADLLRRHGLNRFDALYGLSAGELFKKNRYREVVRIYLRGEHGGHIFHLKRHHPPLPVRLASIFTGLRIRDEAANEWAKMLRLAEVGIPTMTPVAFGSIRRWGLPYRSLTLTLHLYGAEKLEEYLPARFGGGALGPAQAEEKRRIIRETARWARRFHDAGFYHQDFYLGHIFLRPGEGDGFTLHLIDLQRVREVRVVRRDRVVKDLAQINFSAMQLGCVTRTDRLRFLLAYLGTDRLDAAGRDMVRRIAAKTRRIARHTRKLLARRAAAASRRRSSFEKEKHKERKAPR